MQSVEPAMAAGGRRKRTDGSQGSGKNGQRGRCGLHCGVFGELVVGAAINAANQYWVLGGNSIEKSCMRMRAVASKPSNMKDLFWPTCPRHLTFRVPINLFAFARQSANRKQGTAIAIEFDDGAFFPSRQQSSFPTMNNLLEKAKSMSKVVVDSGAKTMLKVRMEIGFGCGCYATM